MADWKYPTILLVMTLMSLLFIINQKQENFVFEISSNKLKFHSNWTSDLYRLKNTQQLKQSLKIKDLTELDLSFAHSKFPQNFTRYLFTSPFPVNLEKVKINVGSTAINNR